MADNFLEKKYDDWRKGKQTIKRVNTSLDSLLSKVGAIETVAEDPEYTVKSAQLEAIINSARRLGVDFTACFDEMTATISVECGDEFDLGQVCLAMKLKAAELKLHGSIEFTANRENRSFARILIFR